MANQTPFKLDFKERHDLDTNFWASFYQTPHIVRVFSIMKEDIEVGMIALEELEEGVVELSVTISPAHRYSVLSLASIKDIFSFPLSLGYKKVIGWTKRSSWKKVLKRIPSVSFMDSRPAHCSDEARFWYEMTRG